MLWTWGECQHPGARFLDAPPIAYPASGIRLTFKKFLKFLPLKETRCVSTGQLAMLVQKGKTDETVKTVDQANASVLSRDGIHTKVQEVSKIG